MKADGKGQGRCFLSRNMERSVAIIKMDLGPRLGSNEIEAGLLVDEQQWPVAGIPLW